jgi:hypothetical protein
MGFWSGSTAPNQAPSYEHLSAGRSYVVVRAFEDYDRFVHAVGEKWIFLGTAFSPYDEGRSFFVSLDGTSEWHFRMQGYPDEQGPILDDLRAYIAPRIG